MTDLIPFNFEDGLRVRTVIADGTAWFVAADVCYAIDLANMHSSIALLDADEKGLHSVETPGGCQELVIVSEAGLYSLILRSRKPEAKRFKRWVTHEVLPAIRKTGVYELAERLPKDYPSALRALAAEVEEKQVLAARNAEIEPAANSWTQLAEAAGDYSLREAAQILDRDPAISTGQNRLSKYLRQISWTDRTGQPYQTQVDTGRLVVRTRDFFNSGVGEQQVTTQLRITVKGLQKLHELLGGSGPLLLAA